jgi:F420-dependent oxidoreductase-like protein
VRLAFKTSPENTTWTAIREVWRLADDIELFEAGWLYDHLHPVFGAQSDPILESWTALSALAQATRRLRLGVMVTGIIYRHPALLAKMAATVDHISSGRLELALGAGWNEEESDAYGIELGTVRERFNRFEEAMQVITCLFAQEATDLSGRYFTLHQARCEPKPIQEPHPPIWIGGVGPRRTLPAAARWAQYWNFPVGTVEEFLRSREQLDRCCEAIGRSPETITATAQVRHPAGADSKAVAHEVAAFHAAGASLVIVLMDPPHRPDVLESLAGALQLVS